MSEIAVLRANFQKRVCAQSVFTRAGGAPSIADGSSQLSSALAKKVIEHLGYPVGLLDIDGQTAGMNFEKAVRDYLHDAMELLAHLRPARWQYSVYGDIAEFVQYQHLRELNDLIRHNRQARAALGDYVVKPDVIVSRRPVSDAEINQNRDVVAEGEVPRLTPFRESNIGDASILHASISCKLTIRSDRSQNARTEGLNLIRNRKGHTPHIAVVTAEPMPTRIASIALGTGDIDCVYHFALHELIEAAKEHGNEAVTETLEIMVEGRRLRDIADLPFDLVV